MSGGKARWRLTVVEGFSAAHALRNFGGKCENLHGHNYTVLVSAVGDELDPDVGIVMDFGVLRAELKAVLEDLDHRNLSEIPPFDEINPSAENLARYIYKNLKARLAGKGAALAEVEVEEKPGQSAAYSEED